MQAQPNVTGRKPATMEGDMVRGIRAIAAVFGLTERQAYNLASRGKLPGVFQMGRCYFGRLSIMEEETRKRATQGAA
jgi:hypothetical protein